MSKSRQLNIPDLLERLIAWQKDIAHEVPYLETPTGYFLNFDETDNGGYTCSPVDSIVFARTGYDGIHYSLLTDFGRVTNLSEAPVICVSPMDFGHCVRIVAENIKDFFALSLFGHDTFLLIDFPTKEAYMQHLREQQELKSTPYFDAELWTRQKKLVQEKAASAFSFPPIEDPFDYVQKVSLPLIGSSDVKVEAACCKTSGVLARLDLSTKSSSSHGRERDLDRRMDFSSTTSLLNA